ncbi:MAG: UMP kinase [Parachlamydia sp.]|jgi:uridylate kinase|nr:UMP kinase [Parachlamydia sp.]
MQPLPKRILMKLSGETLLGQQQFGIQAEACAVVADCLIKIAQLGVQTAVVIGGGNIFRGINWNDGGMARTPADQMGMLATLFNGIALSQAILARGAEAKLMTALECPKVAESYHWMKAQDYLKEGKIVIFVGGTGNPYFTTDTAAALRASEIQASVLFKATKVDGIYNKDPIKYSDAIKYHTITYSEVLAQKLQVMDATAVALCQSNQIPIYVFNMRRLWEGDLANVLTDWSAGTLVKEKERE